MPFKEDVTMNIYKSWMKCASMGFYVRSNGLMLRPLEDFSIEELNHLKWLIEQELESRNAQDND